jgi:hypothetical protein
MGRTVHEGGKLCKRGKLTRWYAEENREAEGALFPLFCSYDLRRMSNDEVCALCALCRHDLHSCDTMQPAQAQALAAHAVRNQTESRNVAPPFGETADLKNITHTLF